MRILGVDPGSRLTGYGCIDALGGQLKLVTHGTLHLSNTSGKAVIPLEERLLSIYRGLSEVIEEVRPDVLAIEKVFFAKNAVSALKLGQARGAAILTAMIHSMKVVEYSPTEVKLAVVGHGQAQKDQVAKMVGLLVGARDFDTLDASDGLALAICHAQTMRSAQKLQSGEGAAYSAAIHAASGRRSRKSSSLADSLGLSLEEIGSKRRVDACEARAARPLSKKS